MSNLNKRRIIDEKSNYIVELQILNEELADLEEKIQKDRDIYGYIDIREKRRIGELRKEISVIEGILQRRTVKWR